LDKLETLRKFEWYMKSGAERGPKLQIVDQLYTSSKFLAVKKMRRKLLNLAWPNLKICNKIKRHSVLPSPQKHANASQKHSKFAKQLNFP
jgi:hypothetical protein